MDIFTTYLNFNIIVVFYIEILTGYKVSGKVGY